MTFNLYDDVESLKRTVAVAGTFETAFPDTDDDGLAGTLMDAFGEAQLDGFFAGYTLSDVGVITENVTRAERALIVIYAAVRILQSEIRNRKSHTRYEAGGAVYEEDQGTSALVELLREYAERKKQLRDTGLKGDAGAAFYMADAYLMRAAGIPYWV